MKSLEKRFVEINAKINLLWNEYIEKHPLENPTSLKINFLKNPQYQKLAEEKISILKEMHHQIKEAGYHELEEEMEMA